MELTLSQKQHVFPTLIAMLIEQIQDHGYEVAFGEAWRSNEEAQRLADEGKGIKNSVHCLRIAIDLLLYKDGKYLTQSEDYRLAGEFWKALSQDGRFKCVWGGDFSKPDGDHFSIAHQGAA